MLRADEDSRGSKYHLIPQLHSWKCRRKTVKIKKVPGAARQVKDYGLRLPPAEHPTRGIED